MAIDYPVLEILTPLKQQLSEKNIVILQAPPGAGKSTVLPLELVNEPWLDGKKMIMLEPRRLAARSVANRMATLKNENVGETIGYRIRFETKVTSRTRIEVVTEGILTRMIQNDNTLEGVGLIIFDEFHERSLQADLALALCLQLQKILRDDLRILIMSATLDGALLSALLGNAPVISTSGKQFPVKHHYYNFDPEARIHVRMARAVRKALTENTGDILAFLPGAGEISRTQTLLETENIGAAIYALYGDLPMKKQQEAILPLPDGRRKVVLATSIAETSLTIEGITVVIDCGYSRVPRFDPRSGLTRLETIRVTKDAADQRSGRAGRLGPGVCYRLWSEGSNASLVLHRSPEILDADLAPLMLELSQWGVSDVRELTWITPPPAGAVSQAKELLQQLDAVENGRITDRGRKMLQLPTHPRIAHMLLSAAPSPMPSPDRLARRGFSEGGGQGLATDVAALLEEKDPLSRDAGADLTLRLEVLRKWRRGEKVIAEKNSLERIERLAESWRRIFKIDVNNSVVADVEVGKLLTAAYPERIARQTERNSERYKLANGRVVKLPPHDPLTSEPWLSVAHLDAGGQGEGKIFLAAPLSEEDLHILAHQQETVRWDAERGMVVGVVEKRIGNVVLETKPLSIIPAEKRINVLCEAVRAEGLKVIGWSEADNQWQARVMSLRGWRPDEGWPDVSEGHLLNTLEEWLSPYLLQANKRTDLQRLNVSSMLTGLLPWNLASRLDTLAPSTLEVPSGSMISLTYGLQGEPPAMEVRLQEVFGLLETPSVNEGKIQVILHLLSPGYKPVQITRDLKSFWQTAYHEVRNELRIRYRKHSWPEDPWTAKAVRGVKKSRQ
jgi:ATP-dependent helicase HrpB